MFGKPAGGSIPAVNTTNPSEQLHTAWVTLYPWDRLGIWRKPHSRGRKMRNPCVWKPCCIPGAGRDSRVLTKGDKSISTWARAQTQGEIRGFFSSGWLRSHPDATRASPMENRAGGRRGRSRGEAEPFQTGARSALLCLLCTCGAGRAPRRGSKYCQKRWSWLPSGGGALPAQPLQDAGESQGQSTELGWAGE